MRQIRVPVRKRTTLDHTVALASAALAIDGIIAPLLIGKTLHQEIGNCYCSPAGQYTDLWEAGLFLVTQGYLALRRYYRRR